MITLFLAAWAQDVGEPAPVVDPSSVVEDPTNVLEDPEVSETVIVYGERMMRAREEVIRELRELGYEKRIDKDGAIVMRHDQAWKGDIWLHDDGWMRIKRQPVRFQAPEKGWAGCIFLPFRCIRSGGQTVSKRKFEAVESRTAAAVGPDVATWGDRVADHHVQETISTLPRRMQKLWDKGVPLEGETILVDKAARRDALLTYWETRTETEWGESVREAVESFLRAVVQNSDDPISDDELRAFNRRSRASRPLVLVRS